MNLTELLVGCGGLLLGYWMVSNYIDGRLAAARAAKSSATDNSSHPQARQDTLAWYHVLGVAEDASAEQIRAAYQRLISQYHPDKVATLGPEIRAIADQKSKELGAAYEAGMSSHQARR